MRPSGLALAALAPLALSCGLVSGGHGGRSTTPIPADASAPAAVLPADEALPGVDLSALQPAQREALAGWSQEAFCACGCPHTVSGCLRGHKTCRHAPRMVEFAAGLAAKGATKDEIARAAEAYYSGFDRRARFDLVGMGAPIGDPAAKVAMVVVSDFTCPFCKISVPGVEQFAKDHGTDVRLYAKPFPLASHAGAQEAAEAGEWARDQGRYWEVQALLYEMTEVPTADNLAEVARHAGLDPAALREALASGKYKQRIERAMGEARAAGLTGTPTVYLNGRKLDDLSQEGLSFALQDELEWVQHGSWIRD
jgi:protein-disulfide isomerase